MHSTARDFESLLNVADAAADGAMKEHSLLCRIAVVLVLVPLLAGAAAGLASFVAGMVVVPALGILLLLGGGRRAWKNAVLRRRVEVRAVRWAVVVAEDELGKAELSPINRALISIRLLRLKEMLEYPMLKAEPFYLDHHGLGQILKR